MLSNDPFNRIDIDKLIDHVIDPNSNVGLFHIRNNDLPMLYSNQGEGDEYIFTWRYNGFNRSWMVSGLQLRLYKGYRKKDADTG